MACGVQRALREHSAAFLGAWQHQVAKHCCAAQEGQAQAVHSNQLSRAQAAAVARAVHLSFDHLQALCARPGLLRGSRAHACHRAHQPAQTRAAGRLHQPGRGAVGGRRVGLPAHSQEPLNQTGHVQHLHRCGYIGRRAWPEESHLHKHVNQVFLQERPILAFSTAHRCILSG
eukprot:CAMPEP_0114238728 /NCGR_PEP_ID=MMETSP0058-20121206/8075_1 /TAXON_ID=36894 /ORGANISM="Pyramimonas parkeae, CCMP726" /LENGTH=172 /DNA_ID=CAMNT_0001350849 /DNA_START=837 /DNA_END=1352 /DNA_ORIENTATION=-